MTLLSRCAFLLSLVVSLPALANEDDELLPPPPPIPVEDITPQEEPPPAPAITPVPPSEPRPLAPAPAPQAAPEREPKRAPEPEPPDEDNDEKKRPGFGSPPFLYTAGAAAAGALALGGLTFLSPCCCGLPFSAPIGALSLGLGAFIGAGIESGWDYRTTLFTGVVGGGCGLASALAGATVAAVTAEGLGATMPNPGVSIALTQGNTLLSSSVAALIASGVLLVGGATAAGLVLFTYPDLEESQPERRTKQRRRRAEAGELPPDLPKEPTVAIAY